MKQLLIVALLSTALTGCAIIKAPFKVAGKAAKTGVKVTGKAAKGTVKAVVPGGGEEAVK